MSKLFAAGGLSAVAVVFVPIGILMMTLGGGVQAASDPGDPPPSAEAVADIPPPLLEAYRTAGRACPGLPWTVLAGIGKVETDHARYGGATLATDGTITPPIYAIVLDGTTPGTAAIPIPAGGSPWHDHPRWDRALGPMQFLTDTFRAVGVDASGDRIATPHNAFDAIASAGLYLCGSDGEVTDLRAAIGRYNHSAVCVEEVLEWAATYTGALVYVGSDPLALVAHPNVTMGAAQRIDLEAGRIDPQLVAILLSLAEGHTFHITSLITGHSICIRGTGTYPACSVSRHASGRAADLWMFDGEVVADANTSARAQVLQWHGMDRTTDPLRPWTIGHPFGDLAGAAPGSFNDGDHEDHFHLSVNGTPTGASP